MAGVQPPPDPERHPNMLLENDKLVEYLCGNLSGIVCARIMTTQVGQASVAGLLQAVV